MTRNPTADKRQRFVEEYTVDLNATQAALRAGYSPKTSSVQGSRLLRDAKVRAAIDALLAHRTRTAELTTDEVINGIRELVRRCEAPGSRFQPFAVLKGYELLGKYKKLWTDRVEVNSDAELIERIEAGRKRVSES